jgi:hypothetical protein
MIKLRMNNWDFKRIIRKMDTCSSSFTNEGLKLLFEYLNDLDGVIKLDDITICCDWTEYKNIESAKKDYEFEGGDLEDSTTVLKGDNDIVVVRDY